MQLTHRFRADPLAAGVAGSKEGSLLPDHQGAAKQRQQPVYLRDRMSSAADAEAQIHRPGRSMGERVGQVVGGLGCASPAVSQPATDLLSIVLPIHNEARNLEPLFREIAVAFSDVPYEIIAVDDGSTDGSAQELDQLAARCSRVRVVSLERRRGQSAALLAGFDTATGELILTMDADGQNDPADGRRLVDALRRSLHATVLIGYRGARVDGWWKRVQSRVANACRNVITGDSVSDTGCSLRVMPRAALLQLPRFDGVHRFLPTLLRMVGEHVAETDVAHRIRLHGKSKYGMWDRLGVGMRDVVRVRRLVKRRQRYLRRNEGTGQSCEVY